MKLIPFLLILLLALVPVAQAASQVSIPVTSKALLVGYTMVQAANYSLQVQSPPAAYGVTNNNLTQIGRYVAGFDMEPQSPIADASRYDLQVGFNGPHVLDFDFNYEPHGYSILRSWTVTRTISQDGVMLCTSTDSGGIGSFLNVGGVSHQLTGNTILPYPDVQMSYKADLDNAAANTTPTFLYYRVSDGVGDPNTESCANPATGINAVNVTSITEGFDFMANAYDDALYGNHIHAEVYNLSKAFQLTNFSATPEAPSCGGLQVNILILNFCFDPSGLVNLIFGGVSSIITGMLTHFIPGGATIAAIIVFPFQAMIALAAFVNDIVFQNGAPYGAVGFFWMHIVYAFTIGCVATAFTGNFLYPFIYPAKFAMLVFYAVGYAAYFFFWILPSKMFEIMTWIWNAITNPIP